MDGERLMATENERRSWGIDMRLGVELVVGLLACGGVYAESLVVVRPGVVCASASALAQGSRCRTGAAVRGQAA